MVTKIGSRYLFWWRCGWDGNLIWRMVSGTVPSYHFLIKHTERLAPYNTLIQTYGYSVRYGLRITECTKDGVCYHIQSQSINTRSYSINQSISVRIKYDQEFYKNKYIFQSCMRFSARNVHRYYGNCGYQHLQMTIISEHGQFRNKRKERCEVERWAL